VDEKEKVKSVKDIYEHLEVYWAIVEVYPSKLGTIL
jgi:hypothetical protein